MSALLYYSYGSKLTESKKLTIDKEVSENRVAVRNFVKKTYGQVKVVIVSNAFGIVIFFSGMKNADAIGISGRMPPAPIMSRTEFVPTYARLTVEKQDKIIFLKNEEVLQSDRTYFNLPENPINTVDELLKLRGGDMSPLTKALFRLIMIWAMGQSHTPTEGF